MPTSQIQAWANPRRILLATDLTDLKFTLPVAIEQAQTYKSELRITHVLPDPNISVIDPVLLVYSDADRLQTAAETGLAGAVEVATNEGVQCSSELSAGDATAEVMRITLEWKADRLIAGSHGKEKFHLHILGSVAESLFHHIKIPVLAIGPGAHETKNRSKRRMRIVFATALGHDSKHLAEFALSVADKHHADITLLYVSKEIPQSHPSAARVTARAESVLQKLAKTRSIGKGSAVCVVVNGHPAEAIPKYAHEHSADLIILGASAHTAFNARFIPGTAHRVLCESSCPVLVLKQESAWIAAPKEAVRDENAHAV